MSIVMTVISIRGTASISNKQSFSAISIMLMVAVFLAYAPHAAVAADFFTDVSALYGARDFTAVEEASLRELQVNPDSLEAYYFLIAIRLFNAQYAEAIPYIREFEKYHKLREKQASEEFGAKTLLIDARFAALYYEIGKYHFGSKRYDEAIGWLYLAKSKFANDPMFNFYIAITYKSLGKYDDALKHLKRQFDLNADEPSPLYNMACVYANAGNTSEAIAWLEKAIKARPAYQGEARVDPDFDKIRERREFVELVGP